MTTSSSYAAVPIMSDFGIDERYVFDDVPGLIELVTKRLTIDVGDVFTKISKEPEQLQGAHNVGFYQTSKKDQTRKKWSHMPDSYDEEWVTQLIAYLNTVTDNVRKIVNGEDWEAGKNDVIFVAHPSLDAAQVTALPDFVLALRETAESNELQWGDIYCVGLLDRNHQFDEAIGILGEQAGKCLYRSGIRTFVIGLFFYRTQFILCVFDRSGTLVSNFYDVHKEPEKFLRGVVCLPLMPFTDLGLDPTAYGKGEDLHFRVVGQEYKVLGKLFASRPPNGKGTMCYEVEGPDGKVYAARDCWTTEESTMRESQFLDLIKDVKNVPRIVAQEIVKVESKVHEPFLDKTSRLRSSIIESHTHKATRCSRFGLWRPNLRDHLRTIYWPCGQRFTDFKSLAELISASIDVFETVETLNDRGMLHSDISVNNIILVQMEGSPYRKGFLIDFETAEQSKSELFTSTGFFTMQTTSPDILIHNCERTVFHEVESIFLTLLDISITMAGPERNHRDPSEYENSFFYTSGNSDPDAPSRKVILIYPEVFREEVLKKIHPYFAPLERCFEGLRGILYAPSERPDSDTRKRMEDEDFRVGWYRERHNAVLAKCKDVLRETLAELTESKGLSRSELNEVDATVLPENSAVKGQDQTRNPEQALSQSQNKEHRGDAPISEASPLPDNPVEKDVEDAEKLKVEEPQAEKTLNGDSETQITGIKRLRSEEVDPLKDLTNEDLVKRLKLSEGKEKESI